MELGHPSFEAVIADYYDDGIAYVTCLAGHKTAHLVQSSKFEVLLESGATALLEGFTFEACASFSVALERFYEFALRVVCTARGLSQEHYGKMFTEMARQSERQLGAFMLLCALELGEIYKHDIKITEFRNSVVHKGAIPTLEQAQQFAARIYSVISSSYRRLHEKHPDHVMNVVAQGLRERQVKVPKGIKVATNSSTIFFNTAIADAAPDFATALEAFKQARQMISGAIPQMQALHDQLKARSF